MARQTLLHIVHGVNSYIYVIYVQCYVCTATALPFTVAQYMMRFILCDAVFIYPLYINKVPQKKYGALAHFYIANTAALVECLHSGDCGALSRSRFRVIINLLFTYITLLSKKKNKMHAADMGKQTGMGALSMSVCCIGQLKWLLHFNLRY